MGAEEITISLRGASLDAAAAFLHRGIATVAREVRFEPTAVVRQRAHDAAVCVLVARAHDVDCRYAVCHPPACDEWFLSLAVALAEALEVELELRDAVGPRTRYHASDAEFLADARAAIAAKRRYWRADFGPDEAALTPEEAIERFVVG